MVDKFKYIPNDNTQKTLLLYNKCLKRLDTELNKQINQNSIKVNQVEKANELENVIIRLKRPQNIIQPQV